MTNEKKDAHIVSFINQKGGVAKTTTTVNTAHALGRKGYKVLVIDMDPQSNASMILGKLTPIEQPKTIVDLFTTEAFLSDCIVPTKYENVDLVSSHIDLFSIKTQMTGHINGIVGLQNKLNKIIYSKYDFVFIDCQPDVGGALVTNALVISNLYIVPIAAEDPFGLHGMNQLETTVKSVGQMNTNLKMLGVLITMTDFRSNATSVIIDTANTLYGEEKVFKTMIGRNATINTAFINNKTILAHDGRASGAKDYIEFADEFLERTGR